MGIDPLAATLTWLDHDATDRDRMNRILALFRERDTRDELGVGVIRDLLADELFPGTSTIQDTRVILVFRTTLQKTRLTRRGSRTFSKPPRAALAERPARTACWTLGQSLLQRAFTSSHSRRSGAIRTGSSRVR